MADLPGHSTSEIAEIYYVKKDTARLSGITEGFELRGASETPNTRALLILNVEAAIINQKHEHFVICIVHIRNAKKRGKGCVAVSEEQRIGTDELLRLLFMESNLEHLMTGSASNQSLPGFPDYITALCKKRGEPPERVINRANIEKSYGHQLFNGRRSPSRDTVLQLAFGFEMDYDAAQGLLKIARKSPLHPKVKRDMVLVFCLHHHYTIVDCQAALQEYGLPLLGEGNKSE